MIQGTKEQAQALAAERWAALHDCDLDPETWAALFAAYRPGEVLQAIGKTKYCRDQRPDCLYSALLYWVGRLAKDRNEKERPLWPPSDVRQL